MVSHVGIDLCNGNVSYYNEYEKVTGDFKINEVKENEIEKVALMFEEIKSKINGKLGCICLHGSYYGNEIRKKFIECGLKSGFKNIEIINWNTAFYLNAMSQINYKPLNGNVIWIKYFNNFYVWKIVDQKARLCRNIKEDCSKMDNTIRSLKPNVVLYEKSVKKIASNILNKLSPCQTYEYSVEATMLPRVTLLKARMIAGDCELAHLNVVKYLDNEMTLKYGNQEILSVKSMDELPIKFIQKFINDSSYNTIDFVPLSDTGEGKVKFEIPNSDDDIILTFEIDKNGICSLNFNSPTVCRFFNHPEIYRNLSFPKGLALIINNRFEGKAERKGTEIDERNIRQRFSQLGYKICTKENLSAADMLKTAKSFAKNDKHKFYDSCVVFVLTHGKYDHLLGVDDKEVNVHEFLKCFNAENAPLLKGKPKLFFIQACRGEDCDYGAIYRDSHNIGLSEQLTKGTLYPNLSPTLMPIEGDMIIAYATPPNYVSWRDEDRGSWFIESVCDIIGKYAKTEEICSILTKVNQKVAEAKGYSEEENGFIKQIPRFESSLTKKFYFILPGTDMDDENLSLSLNTHYPEKPNSVPDVLMDTID